MAVVVWSTYHTIEFSWMTYMMFLTCAMGECYVFKSNNKKMLMVFVKHWYVYVFNIIQDFVAAMDSLVNGNGVNHVNLD